MSIILASGSPRRSELLTMLGIKNFIIDKPIGEEIVPENALPYEVVLSLATQKAREISKKHTDEDIIIAADTIVVIDGEILGKPHDEDEAFSMLKRLSNREHEVYTGVCLMKNGEVDAQYEKTAVRMREISDREILAYIKTGEPMDKAGSYGAQGIGSVFIEGINGDFFNVMGLPLCKLNKMLMNVSMGILD